MAPRDNACHEVAHDRLSLTVGEERHISSQRLPSFGTLGDRFGRGALEAEDWVLYKKKVVKKEISRLVRGVTKMMVSDVENNAWEGHGGGGTSAITGLI